MEVERIERQWAALMKAAVAMKKAGIDTGEAVKKLRDSKVLINHCKFDEHAHGEELFEAEKAVEEVQRHILSLLEQADREGDFNLEPESVSKKQGGETAAPPGNVPRGKSWVRIRIGSGIDLNSLSMVEGVEIIERDKDTITLAGDKASIQKALGMISKGFS